MKVAVLVVLLLCTLVVAIEGVGIARREWRSVEFHKNVAPDPSTTAAPTAAPTTAPTSAPTTTAPQDFPFRDTSLSTEERVNDLVSRLTLDEVVEQIARGGARDNGPSPSITRLNIQPYQWTTECVHGYLNQGTIFPQAIGLAATFSKDSIYNMTRAISLEARAQHNHFMNTKNYGDQTGLSCFAPVINIMRHPLWGRNQETYGEDPFLTGEIASAYVRGLQGPDKIATATATCKHFGVHGGPESIPVSRFGFNSVVSTHDLGTTFLPAFRKCVQSGAHGVMCSYNAINGVPACANQMMMGGMLRGKFGFKGYVVSDENALESIDTDFKYTKNKNETALAAFKAGCDLELKGQKADNRFDRLGPLARDGHITVDELKESVKRLFSTRISLGEFDPPSSLPWWSNVSLDVLQSKEHMKLAEDIATRSFVLLKNDDGYLPQYRYDYGNVSMVGPFAENFEAISGDYVKLYDGEVFSLPAYLTRVMGTSDNNKVASGCVGKWDASLPHCNNYDKSQVEDAVQHASLVFVTLGTGPGLEAEGRDRADLSLPANQLQLLYDTVKYAPSDAKIVVLVFSAGPVDIRWAVNDDRVNAIIQCFFPAQATGGALERVIRGEISPAGRLPFTWYADMQQVPSMTDYSMKDRTYKYFLGQPLFPFGYGLSYTTFTYNKVDISPSHPNGCEIVSVLVDISNVGRSGGDEVIQVYMQQLSDNGGVDKDLLHKLVAFDRVYLYPGETKQVYIPIPLDGRAVWKEGSDGFDYYLENGDFLLYVGGQQPGQSTRVPSNVIETTFTFSGEELLLSTCER